MKSKVSKDLILFIILIPLFLWGAFYISSRMEDRLPAYSVVNKAGTGYSVYFEALKELGYPVERTIKPIAAYDSGSIQLAVQNGSFNVNDEEIKKWVENGGVLVYLEPEVGMFNIEYGTLDKSGRALENEGTLKRYKYYKGTVISADIDGLTNRVLLKNTAGAYDLLEEIGRYPYKKLIFNESHLFAPIYEKSLWDFIPMEIKYLLYQLIIILAAVFYFGGKRFGRPIPLYEEVERTENEYLYSAASLYRQARCWDIMLESYYRDFLRQANSTHDGWLEYWEREKLPELNKARRLYDMLHSGDKKLKAKEYVQAVTALEQLKGILKKRRDSHWKTLKRTM